jgi:pyruvate formate lyase activating enzyme
VKSPVGRLHSIETLGTRDGPGLRCVFFLAGCNFRCQFCQNPDTWSARGSQRITLEQARERLEPLLPYLKQHGGGVTVSGGEPAMQADFVAGLFRLCHELGLTTALDTNGSCPGTKQHALLAVTDTVLLDVKASTEALHRKITGKPLAPTLAFGRMAAEVKGRLVIRRVLLPGINDSTQELDRLAEYILSLPDRPVVELIAYHRLGVHKWKELGWAYPLAQLKPPTQNQWEKAAARLKKFGLTVKRG